MTLAASAQLSIFDENNTPQDKGQVGVTILSQKSTKAHRLFVYDSSKQGMATAELNPDLRAVVVAWGMLIAFTRSTLAPISRAVGPTPLVSQTNLATSNPRPEPQIKIRALVAA